MSFSTLKKEQLVAVANGFGLDVDEKNNVKELKAAIAEADYITWDEAVKILRDEKLWDEEDEEKETERKEEAAAKVAAEPKDTLIKMKRANRSYELLGVSFTREHPYALVTAAVAEAITDLDPEGFVYASPKELKEFYG